MNFPWTGELAALGAALCWAIAAVLFRQAGANVPPVLLNFYKGLVAGTVLAIGILVTEPSQLGCGYPAWTTLLLSGAIGIGIGDTAFFAALNRLGERKSVLIAETLAPLFAVAFGLSMLQESLSWTTCAGMLVTLSGVAWVLAERVPKQQESTDGAQPPPRFSGLGWAILSAGCQAFGAILSRSALTQHEVSPWASSLIRLGGGLLVLLLWISTRGYGFLPGRVQQTGVWRTVLAATLIGTLLGIVLQQTALQYTPAAIAQTLIATSVLFVIPLAYLQGNPVTGRTWLGAAWALVGVAILLSRSSAG